MLHADAFALSLRPLMMFRYADVTPLLKATMPCRYADAVDAAVFAAAAFSDIIYAFCFAVLLLARAANDTYVYADFRWRIGQLLCRRHFLLYATPCTYATPSFSGCHFTPPLRHAY